MYGMSFKYNADNYTLAEKKVTLNNNQIADIDDNKIITFDFGIIGLVFMNIIDLELKKLDQIL